MKTLEQLTITFLKTKVLPCKFVNTFAKDLPNLKKFELNFPHNTWNFDSSQTLHSFTECLESQSKFNSPSQMLILYHSARMNCQGNFLKFRNNRDCGHYLSSPSEWYMHSRISSPLRFWRGTRAGI